MLTKRTVSALLTLGLLCAAAPRAGAATEIAALNVARVFEKYEMTHDLETLFDQARRAAADEAEKRRGEADQLRKALAAFDPASEDYRKREQEADRSELEFQAWSKATERRLKSDHLRWMKQIYHNTQNLIAEVAKERGIDLVLTYDELTDDAPDSVALRQQILLQKVIYHDPAKDITDEVLRRLNAAYRKTGGIRSIEAPPEAKADPAGGGAPAAPAQPDSAQVQP